MAIQHWVYRRSDGQLLYGGFSDVVPPLLPPDANGEQVPDFATYSVVTVPDAVAVDARLQRAVNDTTLRAATAPEITIYDTTMKTTRFTATSRQKDILATCAQIVRARGIVAWNAMTLQQKKDATLAEADIWVNIRSFIEDNL